MKRSERSRAAQEQVKSVSKVQKDAMRALGEPVTGLILGAKKIPKRLGALKETTVSLFVPAVLPEDHEDRYVHRIPVYKIEDKVAASGKKTQARIRDPSVFVTRDALRPLTWLSWGEVESKHENTIACLRQAEMREGGDSITVSSQETMLKSTLAAVTDALGHHLPREALMLPNLRQHPEAIETGVYLFYHPRCEKMVTVGESTVRTMVPVKAVEGMRMLPEVDMDDAAVKYGAVVVDLAINPMSTTAATQAVELSGTVTQWSDGSHPLKALSHHNGKFEEDVLVLAKVWPDHLKGLFGIADVAMWNSCALRWLRLMPMVFVGTPDTETYNREGVLKSPGCLKMPVNMEAADETEQAARAHACGVDLKIGIIGADPDGFFRMVLPPVTPAFLLECCRMKDPLLKESQYILTQDDRDWYNEQSGDTYCVSLLKNRQGVEGFIKGEAAKMIGSQCGYRVMINIDIPDSELPTFGSMTPVQGTEIVKSFVMRRPDEVRMVIYAVRGVAARTTPEHAASVLAVATKLGLVARPAAAAAAAADAAPAPSASVPPAAAGMDEPPAKKVAVEQAATAPSAAPVVATVAPVAHGAKPPKLTRPKS
jgi:hypothetical protein